MWKFGNKSVRYCDLRALPRLLVGKEVEYLDEKRFICSDFIQLFEFLYICRDLVMSLLHMFIECIIFLDLPFGCELIYNGETDLLERLS